MPRRVASHQRETYPDTVLRHCPTNLPQRSRFTSFVRYSRGGGEEARKRRLIRVRETLPTWTATAILLPVSLWASRDVETRRSRLYDDGMRDEAFGALARVSSSLLSARVVCVTLACACVYVSFASVRERSRRE